MPPPRAPPGRSRRRWSCGRAGRGRTGRRPAARPPGPAPWPACPIPPNAGSHTCSPDVAPQATASRRTSSALGGPERDDGARSPGGLGQGDPLGDGASAVRVHLEVDAVADQPPPLEAERLGERHLLGQRRDPQRLPLGSRHRTALTSPRRQRRAPAPRPGPGWPGCGRSARRGSTTPPRPPGSDDGEVEGGVQAGPERRRR